MSVSAQEYEHEQPDRRIPDVPADGPRALVYDGPAVGLAGESDDDESEPHIWRGTD